MLSSTRLRCWITGAIACSGLFVSVAMAGGKRPVVQRFPMHGERLAQITEAAGAGGVAQTGASAVIYRSIPCGFQSWIGGMPSWLDEQIHFNDNGGAVPLRSIRFPACYDTCHRGNRCVFQDGPQDCDCLAPGDLPITSTFQVWDGDPCWGGVMIDGAGGSVTVTDTDIPDDQIMDGQSNCFDFTITIDPKVMVPHEVWVEANYGHDDGWPLTGGPGVGQGSSPLAGLNDGVSCSTWCDRGTDPLLCRNDEDGCDWILHNATSNAQYVFTLRPRSGGAGTVVGQEIAFAKGGERVDFDVFVSDYDPQQMGIEVVAWQSTIDSSGYTSGLYGTLTPVVVSCDPLGPSDQCDAANLGMGDGSVCNPGNATCNAAYIDCTRPDSLLGCIAIGEICDVSTLDFTCGATTSLTGIPSPGTDSYLWSLALEVSPGAKGTFTIDLMQPADNVLLGTNSELLPLAGVVPAQVTVETGACCDLSNFVYCVGEGFTANGCEGAGPQFAFARGRDCEACGETCIDDAVCSLGPRSCLIGACINSFCEYEPVPPNYCCGTWDPLPLDDGNQCTIDTCSGGGPEGDPVHTPAAPGTPCDDGDECTISDACSAAGICTGEESPACAAVPATSAWGIAVLTLLLPAVAKIHFGHRRAPTGRT